MTETIKNDDYIFNYISNKSYHKTFILSYNIIADLTQIPLAFSGY